MAKRIPYVLCHPDGNIFAEYLTTAKGAHMSYFIDGSAGEELIEPSKLGIKRAGYSNIEDLVWLPVKQAVANPPKFMEQTFPYDDETGDPVEL